MFNRYDLDVSYKGNKVFMGSFRSINHAVKVASMFDKDCFLTMYDNLLEKQFSDPCLWNLVKEFQDGEIYL